MERRLRLDQMAPEKSMEGSRMSTASLTTDEIMGRVTAVVGENFSLEDLNKVPCAPPRDTYPS